MGRSVTRCRIRASCAPAGDSRPLAAARPLHSGHGPAPTTTSPRQGIAIDPVCGMRVGIEGAQHTSDYEGITYYFCGKGCRLDFEDDPERFLSPDYRPSM